MGGILIDRWSVPSTAVAHEFIDEYMAGANGEYVKVYLFVLRHLGEEVSIERIADALDHTESDVRRALAYWEKLGILAAGREEAAAAAPFTGRQGAGQGQPAQMQSRLPRLREQDARLQDAHLQDIRLQDTHLQDIHMQDADLKETDPQDAHGQAIRGQNGRDQEAREGLDRPVYSAGQVNRLSQDEGFSQLLYIAQKYLNKVFTPRDCQAFAYLYEDLGMDEELLEYLVEYCVQNGHSSIRYIEAVARSWHGKGIHTAQEAKEEASSYSKDSFAVMKAFGINSRKPAAPEQKLMDKWFKEYGFNRDVVLEACDRTITAIHNPSFQYADKILMDWKDAGVRALGDIRELDARRQAAREEKSQSRDKRLQKYDTAVSGQGNRARKGAPNQFHNFEQRDTDYDALMLKQVKEWVGSSPDL